MSQAEGIKKEVEQFLESVSVAHQTSIPASMSFFVKELGWIHAKFAVPVISVDGINYMDILAMDGSFHKIKEEYIIDQRITVITPEFLEQFMELIGDSVTTPTENGPESEMFG